MTILQLGGSVPYRFHVGLRVRVIWNPQVNLWYVYDLTEDFPIFSTSRLELHTVGVYGELRPKYAPEGSPSFVGTIVAHEIVDKGEQVEAHPNAPAKLYFEGGIEEFNHCRRILLSNSTMIADRRPIPREEHEKIK